MGPGENNVVPKILKGKWNRKVGEFDRKLKGNIVWEVFYESDKRKEKPRMAEKTFKQLTRAKRNKRANLSFVKVTDSEES